MIRIGIDAHKKRCVATLKKDNKNILEVLTLDNRTRGFQELIGHARKYNEPYRTMDHDMTETKYKRMERHSRTV